MHRSLSAACPPRSTLKVAVGTLMLSLWLLSFLLAAVPELHHWLHDDADHPTHQCVATRLQHEPLQVLEVYCSVAAPQTPSFHFISRTEPLIISVLAERFSPSRAPPFSVLLPSLEG